jgi:hypothetical protein
MRSVIATYLREPLEGDFAIILDALSGPLRDSEILAVNPLGPSDFGCSTRDTALASSVASELVPGSIP